MKNVYVIYSLSKTKSGFNIASDPYFKLPCDIDNATLITAIKNAVNSSKKDRPDPINWNLFRKAITTSLGIKSWSELEKKGNLHCDIMLDENNDLIITPSKRALSPDKGFLYKTKDLATRISAAFTNDEIFIALNIAFSRCE